MDPLTNIEVSFPDTIIIANTPKEVILHSCPDIMPLGHVVTICATVVICLLIIAIATCKCLKKVQEVKKHETNKRFEAEKNKRKSEQDFKILKDQYDSAWRTFEYMLKGQLPEGSKDAGTEAKEYIKLFWEQKRSDITEELQS